MATDPNTLPEGWTAHEGGACPVEPTAFVVILYRGEEDQAKGIRIPFAPAARLDWSHDGGADDIIAYKVEEV